MSRSIRKSSGSSSSTAVVVARKACGFAIPLTTRAICIEAGSARPTSGPTSAVQQHDAKITHDGRGCAAEGQTDEFVFGLTNVCEILHVREVFGLDEFIRDFG